jgi:cytidylate kinase
VSLKQDAEKEVAMVPKQGAVIAIDGPAGTGKSSATKRLAEALGFVHVDTGALYRSIAYLLLERKRKSGEEPSADDASKLARAVHLEFKRILGKNPANRVFANGQDVTEFIRTPEVSMMASQVSAIPEVRAALLGLQRRMGCAGHSILEGRDIGTVIFPDADVKFFLTASVEERAKRRLAELEASGADAPSFEEVKAQIAARDKGDSSRAVAPLKKAPDAIELDTSKMTLDEVVSWMEKRVRDRLTKAGVSID